MNNIDPVDIFDQREVGIVLTWEKKQTPQKLGNESDAVYLQRLRQVGVSGVASFVCASSLAVVAFEN